MNSIAICITALFGFLLCIYIHRKYSKNEKLVCFLGENCNNVINSHYAKTFGIPNVIIGMIYYSLIAATYGFSAIWPFTFPPIFLWGLYIATASAALFSIRLIAIQAFILKEWCEWCLASSIISISIFLAIIL